MWRLKHSIWFLFSTFYLMISCNIFVVAGNDHSGFKRSSSDCQKCCNDTCLTVDCVREAAQMYSFMNANADPCENFPDFACGGYKKQTLPKNRGTLSPFFRYRENVLSTVKEIITEELKASDQHYLKMAKFFFRSCMNTDELERINYTPYLSTEYAKEWPTLVGNRWQKSGNFNVAQLVEKYAAVYTTPLFKIESVVNDKNNSIYFITIYTTFSSTLPHQYYLGARNGTVLMALEKYYRDMTMELGADPIIAAEDALSSEDGPYNMSRHHFTLGSLYQDYSWIGLPQAIRAAYATANVTLDDDETVVLRDFNLTYFSQLKPFLRNCTEREIRNLFAYQYASGKVLITERMRKFFDSLSQQFSGRRDQKPRLESCLFITRRRFNHALSKEYVRRALPAESKAQAEEMIENIRAAYISRMQYLTWMGNSTKEKAIEKLQALISYVAQPDNFTDDDLNSLYGGWVMAEKNYYQNLLVMVAQLKISQYRLLRKSKERRWNLDKYAAMDVNAYHEFVANSLYLPAGMMQAPTFSSAQMLAHNYGASGSIIGHEFSHGFDRTGSEKDIYGNRKNWWQDEDRRNYTAKLQCFINQYANYTYPELEGQDDVEVDAKNSVDEITGDIGGMQQSY
ncbi:endothelin-converting enzyme-like 1, partial [Plakobranchus ocellatus]